MPVGAPAAPKPATWLTPSVLHRSAVRASYLGAVSSNEQKHGFAAQWVSARIGMVVLRKGLRVEDRICRGTKKVQSCLTACQ